jgi:hypothetical protein
MVNLPGSEVDFKEVCVLLVNLGAMISCYMNDPVSEVEINVASR